MKNKITLLLAGLMFTVFVNCKAPSCVESMPTDMLLISTEGEHTAMGGYDVTAFFTDKKAVKGSSTYQVMKNGVAYHFANVEAMSLFEANPERYLPQYGGYCAVAASFNKVEPAQIDLFDVYELSLIHI